MPQHSVIPSPHCTLWDELASEIAIALSGDSNRMIWRSERVLEHCVCVCLCVCVCACLSFRLSICPSIYLSIYLSVCVRVCARGCVSKSLDLHKHGRYYEPRFQLLSGTHETPMSWKKPFRCRGHVAHVDTRQVRLRPPGRKVNQVEQTRAL